MVPRDGLLKRISKILDYCGGRVNGSFRNMAANKLKDFVEKARDHNFSRYLPHREETHYYCQMCGKEITGQNAIISPNGHVYCAEQIPTRAKSCYFEGLFWKEGMTGLLPAGKIFGPKRMQFELHYTKRIKKYDSIETLENIVRKVD